MSLSPIDPEERLAHLLRQAAMGDQIYWTDLPLEVRAAWVLTVRAIVVGLVDGTLYGKIGR